MSDQESKQPEASPYEPSEVANQPRVRLRRRFPPVWVCIAVSLLVVLIGVIRIFTVSGDHAIVNILTLVFGFLALNVVAFWYFFRSAYPGWLRLGTALGGVAAVVLFFSLFKVNDVSGDMVPTFRFRYEPAPDELLETPVPQGTAKGVEVTSEHDFPQFLGPDRNGVIADRKLRTGIHLLARFGESQSGQVGAVSPRSMAMR